MKLRDKTLRYYQEECVISGLESIKSKNSNPLIVLPTGSGKTLVICGLIIEWLKENEDKSILVVSHVKEILSQNYDALIKELDEPIGLYSAGLNRKDVERVTVVSMQTGRNSPEVFEDVGLVIVDEAHLVNEFDEGTYRKFLSNFDCNVIGLTATPYRNSGYLHLSEEALFTDICIDYTTYEKFNQLTSEGHLSKIYSKATDFIMELQTGVRTTAGDWNNQDLDILFNNEYVTKLALDEFKKIYDTGIYKKILVFCINIKHSELVSQMMNDMGIPTGFVHSKMKNDRFQEVEDFRTGKLKALTNVNTLTTGLDIPDIDMLVILRNTKSIRLYVQMVGRVARVSEGKDHGFVMDFANNINTLGPINDVNINQKGKPKKGGEAPIKECPKCKCQNHPINQYCEACGYKFLFKTKLTTSASNLDVTKRKEPKVLKVKSVEYVKHKKKNSPDSFRIDYRVGLRKISRWLVVESFSLRAASIAKSEVPKMLKEGETINEKYTVDTLLENQDKFKVPVSLLVDTNDKYPKIEEIYYEDSSNSPDQ